MNTSYDAVKRELQDRPRVWLVTGVAGFIGSNLLEHLLKLGQTVKGIDNFSTGKRENLFAVRSLVRREQWDRFTFLEGDIRSITACRRACRGAEIVLHQAGLGSVSRSIAEPLLYNEANITGTLNVLTAARDSGIARMVFASSSSVYGDDPALPMKEERIGAPLSPYAVTKYADELYASVYGRLYGMETVGLRYFNVFGPRQNFEGPYAAVIPAWVRAMIRGETAFINGDGSASRDFCYVENAVQANLLAATVHNPEAVNRVYNIAVGARTTLNELFAMIRERLSSRFGHLNSCEAEHRDFRKGDIRHSLADIEKARQLLGYAPTHTVAQGLDAAMEWYIAIVAAATREKALSGTQTDRRFTPALAGYAEYPVPSVTQGALHEAARPGLQVRKHHHG